MQGHILKGIRHWLCEKVTSLRDGIMAAKYCVIRVVMCGSFPFLFFLFWIFPVHNSFLIYMQ
jgi:hypothetical protein